jgi:hypothetical protein
MGKIGEGGQKKFQNRLGVGRISGWGRKESIAWKVRGELLGLHFIRWDRHFSL